MNFINGVTTSIFDVILVPFELLGPMFTMIVVSGIFGILALLAFKHISWQKGIKSTKDRIKGHLIEIRIYQDDLFVVFAAIGKILFRNAQYVGLNFGPFIPLAIPFVLVASQLVVRYGFEPLPLVAAGETGLPGQGVMIHVEMKPGHEAEIAGLQIEGVRDVHAPRAGVDESTLGLWTDRPFHRAATDGRAFWEVYGAVDGEHEITLRLADGTEVVKKVACGSAKPRTMQGERTGSFWSSWLWPAEDSLAGTPFARIHFEYPMTDFGWVGDGPLGVLIILVLASMGFGFAALKPLGVTI